MFRGKAEAGAKAGNKMVVTGGFGFGGDVDGGPGVRTDGGGVRGGRYGDGYGQLIKWGGGGLL